MTKDLTTEEQFMECFKAEFLDLLGFEATFEIDEFENENSMEDGCVYASGEISMWETSRFFIIWTRADARVAALDVHILRWLRSKGHTTSKNTPASKKAYEILEKAFLKEAESLGMTPQALDQKIWSEGAGEDWETQGNV